MPKLGNEARCSGMETEATRSPRDTPETPEPEQEPANAPPQEGRNKEEERKSRKGGRPQGGSVGRNPTTPGHQGPPKAQPRKPGPQDHQQFEPRPARQTEATAQLDTQLSSHPIR